MYPQVLLFAAAILYKEGRAVLRYALPLSVIGAGIAAHHYYIQVAAAAAATCSATGPSCAEARFFTFGYITIPMMALTAFLLLLLLAALARAGEKSGAFAAPAAKKKKKKKKRERN